MGEKHIHTFSDFEIWTLKLFSADFQSKGERYTYLSKVRVSNRPFGLGINNNHFHSR